MPKLERCLPPPGEENEMRSDLPNLYPAALD